MSFSSTIREALLREPAERECCLRAELAALTQALGSLGFRGGGQFSVTYQTDQIPLARRVFVLLKEGLGLSPQLQIVKHARFGGKKTCVLTVEGADAPKLLSEMDMMEAGEDGQLTMRRTSPRPALNRQCCKKAYMRGAFLGIGSMTSPEKSYHMEFTCPEEGMAQQIERLLEKANIPARHQTRRGKTVVYLKSADAIADALTLMGANQARMELENVRIRKQMRGQIARMSNCDEHNDNRMMDASLAQIRAITFVRVEYGLYPLPPALREVAEARLQNPDATLEQLGQLLDPPIGKSAVNARMRRLMSIARELEQKLAAQADEKGSARFVTPAR